MLCEKQKHVGIAGLLLFLIGTGCSPTREDVQEYCPIPLPESTRVIEYTREHSHDWSCEYELEFSREDYLTVKEAWSVFKDTHELVYSGLPGTTPDIYKWKERAIVYFIFDDANYRVRGRCSKL
jgi:hypothetical protein